MKLAYQGQRISSAPTKTQLNAEKPYGSPAVYETSERYTGSRFPCELGPLNVCRVQKRAIEPICQNRCAVHHLSPTEKQADLPDFISLKKHHALAGWQADCATT